jgi:hypothetical protein
MNDDTSPQSASEEEKPRNARRRPAQPIRPIGAGEVQNAPLIPVRLAAKLSGIGDSTIRRALVVTRVGSADYVRWQALNQTFFGLEGAQ